MRKIIAIGSIFCMAFFSAATCMADTGTGAAGGQITISDATNAPDSGATLTYSTSPGVIVAWCTTAATYALASMNTNAADADRNEYGIYSGYSGYYQHPNNNADDSFNIDVTGLDDTADLTDPFAGNWTGMGGTVASGT